MAWHNLFPSMKAENLEFFGSDHRPIYLNLNVTSIQFLNSYPRRFTFEHKWLLEDDFSDVFKNCWDNRRGSQVFLGS